MKRKRNSNTSETVQPDAAIAWSSTEYDVFLNFRGADTRYAFADCLYEFLMEAGIRVFMDDEALRVGDEIGDELLKAIDASRIYVPVFSRTYASSKWCLIELARILKRTMESDIKEILPVFFDVEPEDVKLKTELYTGDLLLHEESFDRDTVRKWRKALRKVSRMKGWKLRDYQGHGKLIKRIAEDISHMLELRNRFLPNHLIGIDPQVQAVLDLLDCGSNDVRIVVIHGMGGIGKTTLANAIFNKVFFQFQGCSFLSNVRELSEGNGTVNLQNKLLQDILKFSSYKKFYDTNDGMIRMRRALRTKNVLIVLDDENDTGQIMKLIGMGGWIGPGSRVIITTRNLSCTTMMEEVESNVDFLQSRKIYVYEMRELRDKDSLELLSWHAFGQFAPPVGFEQLSRDVLSFTRGVPLAIEVIGLYLRRKSMAIWKETLKKLKKIPEDRLYQDILMLSYVMLCDEEKEIFLDIAFFFCDQDKMNAFHYWEACDLFPEMSINTLVSYALVKIDSNRFWMHDLLKDLAREVVRRQGIDKLGRRSRLCNEDAKHVLLKKQGTRKVKALKLSSSHAHDFIPAEMSQLSGLRFLEISGGNFVGGFHDCLSELRWLYWHNCPTDFRGTDLCLKHLVVLRLSGSNITDSWGGWEEFMTATKLKVLELEGTYLTTTSGSASVLTLEKLVVNDYGRLADTDHSVGNLESLHFLDIKGNDHPGLPEDVPPRALREMLVGNLLPKSCHENFKLPSLICNLRALSRLEIKGVVLEQLPECIGQLKDLKILKLEHCGMLHNLPDSIGELKSLCELRLNRVEITEVPESVGKLKNLRLLDVSNNLIRRLPATIGFLDNLEMLFVDDNEHLKEFPIEVCRLQSLKCLNMSRTGIRRLPISISQLFRLQRLYLMDCHKIQKLPELPSSLNSLSFSSRSLKVIPNLSNQTNLVHLSLFNTRDRDGTHICHQKVLSGDMSWIRRLQKLEDLHIILSPMVPLSSELESLHQLKGLILSCPRSSCVALPSQLEFLQITDPISSTQLKHHSKLGSLSKLVLDRSQIQLYGLELLQNLTRLAVYDCQALIGVPDISKLKKLKCLYLNKCLKLMEIGGLANVQSLEELFIIGCDSIQSLPYRLDIEAPCKLILYVGGCRHLRRFYGPYNLYKWENKN